MTKERFIELFDKSQNGFLSASEADELNEWIGLSKHKLEMVDRLQDEEYLKRIIGLLAKARLEDWQNIIEKHPELRPEGALIKQMKYRRLIRISVTSAAAVILIVLTTYLFVNNKRADQQLTTTNNKQVQQVKPPEINKARITLANGQEIALDMLTAGGVALQGNVHVIKTSDGQITYKGIAVNGKPVEIAYNTLTNPRGSKIVSINLSDGTIVWLNSESTLRYPVIFNGNERRVELTGEAYFEVATSFNKSGKKRPFYVTANDVTVEVLGTHFDINNYSDESIIKVTLLEGSVKVRVGNSVPAKAGAIGNNAVILKPGEQASLSQLSQTSQSIPVQTVDLDQVMAWKNNTFYFDGESLQSIMKQLARYYDVEVEYEGNVPDKKFGGMINRNKNLNEVLNVLELSEIHFRVEGNKITVLK
jgi:hypothetical protein